MRKRFVAFGAVVLLLVSLIVVTIRFTAGHVSHSAAATPLALANVKEVAYMPADAGYEYLWTEWNPTQVNSDLASISALGANTVRVFIDATTFGYPTPTTTMTGELSSFISMASTNGLHVQLSLFDNFDYWTQTAQSITFLNALLSGYQNDPRIAIIELNNEIDPTNASAMSWAGAMIPQLRTDAGSIPITISTAGSAGTNGLQELKTALASTPPDFYDYHYYGSAGAATAILATAQQIASPSPLFVGEAGLTTYGTTTTALDSQQAAFYQGVNGATSSLGLPDAAAWIMYDMNPSDVPPGKQPASLDFGLYNVDNTPKPAAAVEQAFFNTGSTQPIANPGFESVSSGLPTGWSTLNPADGTLAVDSTVSHGGNNSVSVSGTSGTTSTEPGYEAVGNLGVISAGQHVQAFVYAKGAAATGQSLISIAWFTSADVFISNSKSVTLPPGNSNWMQIGVNGTAPSGAAYATVNLQSYANSGTVWFDDASLVNLGTAAFPALPPVPYTSGVGPIIANPGFETVNAGAPASWTISNPTNGTLVSDSTVAHGGTSSVSISATSGTSSAEPGWEAIANLGSITTGENVQALVYMKGLNTTGNNLISVAWFTVAGAYISNSKSVSIPDGTSDWMQVGVNSTAPAGSAYATVNLQSYANSGTVWFDDVSMANLGTAAFPPLPVVPYTTGVGPTIANPGFETLSGGLPTNWTISNAANGTLVSDSTVAHGGSASVSISATSGTSSSEPGWEAVANLGSIATGDHVQSLVYIKGLNATGQSLISVAWFTAAGGYISNSKSVSIPVGTSNWMQVGVNSTAPAGAAYATVNLQSYANSGTVWFDDASLVDLGTAAFPALPVVPYTTGVGPTVANPGFETVSAGVPANWTVSNPSNGTVASDSTVAHSGAASVSISATSGTSSTEPGYAAVANLGSITTGQNIQATVWAQGSAATGQNLVSIAWFTASSGFISNSKSVSLPTGTTTWKQTGVNATAPANAAYATINLQSYQNTGTVWFDDVALTNLGSGAFPPLPS